jgi:hypothetical protein
VCCEWRTGILHLIQINHQPDATIFQIIILTFVYSSTFAHQKGDLTFAEGITYEFIQGSIGLRQSSQAEIIYINRINKYTGWTVR